MADQEEKKKKPKKASALKREIQHNKRRERNKAAKSQIRTSLRSFREKKKDLKEIYSVLDKAVKKGVVNPNKANRLKSRFASLS